MSVVFTPVCFRWDTVKGKMVTCFKEILDTVMFFFFCFFFSGQWLLHFTLMVSHCKSQTSHNIKFIWQMLLSKGTYNLYVSNVC